MKLTGIHLLLTYQCNLECDHCFVWGGQWQTGTMTLPQLRNVLQQAKELGTVSMIYFEGGEPSLYYATMVKGIQEAAAMGFDAGIVSNGYWATSEEDALAYLEPFRGLVQDLSISSDTYHWYEELGENIKHIEKVAEELAPSTRSPRALRSSASPNPKTSTQRVPWASSRRGSRASCTAAGRRSIWPGRRISTPGHSSPNAPMRTWWSQGVFTSTR